MLAFTKTATVLVLATLAIASPTPIAVPRDDLAGVISAPPEGTVIAPGQAFDFSYGIHADYCSSSYSYSVWLMTEMPQAFSPSPTFMTGYLFGTYDAANYPAVPYATNPAPAQLTMPDLSQDQGGWGSGASATNATFYVMVWEEWASCDGSLGKRISLAMNSIIYNATTTTA